MDKAKVCLQCIPQGHRLASLPPLPFLMKMIPVALIDNNNTKQLKAMGGWREEKGFS